MSFRATSAIDVFGSSTTGTKHTLLIERDDSQIRFTVLGPAGKRHATVVCEDIESTTARITGFLLKGQQQ